MESGWRHPNGRVCPNPSLIHQYPPSRFPCCIFHISYVYLWYLSKLQISKLYSWWKVVGILMDGCVPPLPSLIHQYLVRFPNPLAFGSGHQIISLEPPAKTWWKCGRHPNGRVCPTSLLDPPVSTPSSQAPSQNIPHQHFHESSCICVSVYQNKQCCLMSIIPYWPV